MSAVLSYTLADRTPPKNSSTSANIFINEAALRLWRLVFVVDVLHGLPGTVLFLIDGHVLAFLRDLLLGLFVGSSKGVMALDISQIAAPGDVDLIVFETDRPVGIREYLLQRVFDTVLGLLDWYIGNQKHCIVCIVAGDFIGVLRGPVLVPGDFVVLDRLRIRFTRVGR